MSHWLSCALTEYYHYLARVCSVSFSKLDVIKHHDSVLEEVLTFNNFWGVLYVPSLGLDSGAAKDRLDLCRSAHCMRGMLRKYTFKTCINQDGRRRYKGTNCDRKIGDFLV